MIPPQILIGGAAMALLAGFLGGWTVRDWKADAAQLAAVEKAEKLKDAMQGKVDDKAAAYEALLASHNETAAATTTQLREVYREIKVPAECAMPADAVGLLDDARNRANAEATGKPRNAVPDTPDAAGSHDRP